MHFRSSSLALGLATLGCLSSVSAHGYIANVVVNNKLFAGPKPGGAPPTNGIRPVKSVNPISMDELDSSALTCGVGSSPAPASIPMKPGETITFFWSDFDTSTRTNKPWVHAKGPIITYLTPCPGGIGGCTKFLTNKSPVFFKFDEKGFKGDPADEIWVQSDIKNEQGIDVTLPETIFDGEYILRHEIVVLEGSQAEVYPSCVQIAVSGTTSGARFPETSFGLLFPGAYKATDPGFQVNFTTPYQFPGGPIAFGNPAAPPSAPASTSSASTASSTSTLLATTSAVGTTTTQSSTIATTSSSGTKSASSALATSATSTSKPSASATTSASTQLSSSIAPSPTGPAFATITETVVVTVTQPPITAPPAQTTTPSPVRPTSTITKVVTVAVGADGQIISGSSAGAPRPGYKRSSHRRSVANRISYD